MATSNRRVSFENNLEDILRKYILNEQKCECRLKEYLKKAGAIFVDDEKDADINLSIEKLNKDTIISLFN